MSVFPHAILLVLCACGAVKSRGEPQPEVLGSEESEAIGPLVIHKNPDARAWPGETDDEKPIASADELLTRLETADADLRTLQGDVQYTKHFALEDSTHVRKGKIYFDSEPPAADAGTQRRRVAIRFESLQVDGAVRDDDQHYIFDGRWLIEQSVSRKQIIRRELVREGEPFDALKIGEGPLPIPVGQKKKDVQERFEAALVAPEDGLPAQFKDDLRPFVSQSLQLHLKPKEAAQRPDDLVDIRLWYRESKGEGATRLLPRLAVTVDRAGNTSVFQLVNVKVNEPLKAGDLEANAPTAPAGEGWDVREERLPEPDR